MPTTQKAAVTPVVHGGFVVQTIDVPTPAKDEVLIKIQAAGLNPMDWKMHDSNVYITSYPYVLGGDIAGVVDEVGEDVKDFKVGDRV
ncbi:GroES-like protein [Atractiella rhizophila]|nr:GroES-like protein [Atractiella rhizophila]